MADAHADDEPCQRDLGGVRRFAEHGFAEEGAAEPDAVEPADEFIPLPAFNRMGVPCRMKAERRALDLGVDPGLVPLGAGVDDLGEGPIAGNGEGSPADDLL